MGDEQQLSLFGRPIVEVEYEVLADELDDLSFVHDPDRLSVSILGELLDVHIGEIQPRIRSAPGDIFVLTNDDPGKPRERHAGSVNIPGSVGLRIEVRNVPDRRLRQP